MGSRTYTSAQVLFQDHVTLSSDDSPANAATITRVKAEERFVGELPCSLWGLFILFSHWSGSCRGRGALAVTSLSTPTGADPAVHSHTSLAPVEKVALGLVTAQLGSQGHKAAR